MFHSAIRSARASSRVEKYSFRCASAPPCSFGLSLPDPCPIISCSAVIRSLGLFAVLLGDRDLLRRRGELLERHRSRVPCRSVRELPVNRKLLLPYFSRISFSLGRLSPIVVTWKSPVSITVSTAFAIGGLHALLLVLLRPRRVILEVLRVRRQLEHQLVQLLVGDADEALRRALGGARIAIDLDEAVDEIHRRIVLHPARPELEPVGRVARLVVADQGGE